MNTQPPPHYWIEDSADTLKVAIPIKRPWFRTMCLFAILLVFWSLALGQSGFPKTLSNLNTDLVTALSILLAFFLLCNVFLGAGGKSETIEVTEKSIVVRIPGLFAEQVRKYPVERIRNLRGSIPMIDFGWLTTDYMGRRMREDASIWFDWGPETRQFGHQLKETEAKQIVSLIKERFPQYR